MINLITEIDKIASKIKELDFINYVEYYPVFKLGNRLDAVMIKIGNSKRIEENSNNIRIQVPLSFIYINKSKKNKISKLLEQFNLLIYTINHNKNLTSFLTFNFNFIDFGNNIQKDFKAQDPKTGSFENLAVKSIECLIEYCVLK